MSACSGVRLAGGPGPAGPHGSRWRCPLEREYRTEPGTPESPDAYALCYERHDRNSILNDESFPTHRKHVADEATSCSVCHDPHGVEDSSAVPGSGSHRINFDVSVVTLVRGSGLLEFEDLGINSGRCYMACHGTVYAPAEH